MKISKKEKGEIHSEINMETGEITKQYAVVPIVQKVITGGFFMAMQEGFMHIAQMDLTGEQLKVLMYVMGKLDFENYILVSQQSIADALNMRKQNVSRALKVIIEKGIIHEGPKVGRVKTYRLDPSFGYKGKAKNMTKLVKDLQVIKGGKE